MTPLYQHSLFYPLSYFILCSIHKKWWNYLFIDKTSKSIHINEWNYCYHDELFFFIGAWQGKSQTVNIAVESIKFGFLKLLNILLLFTKWIPCACNLGSKFNFVAGVGYLKLYVHTRMWMLLKKCLKTLLL